LAQGRRSDRMGSSPSCYTEVESTPKLLINVAQALPSKGCSSSCYTTDCYTTDCKVDSSRSPKLLINAAQALPGCVIRSGSDTFSPALLSSWEVGGVVWSDRAWTYTHLGSFTTSAFQFKVQTSVDRRKASYTFTAPPAHGVDIYILGETKRVIAPWAFTAGEPELDKSWEETCETLPEYEAGVACQFDFCRRRTLAAGESLSFDALAGGKIDVFMKKMNQGRSVWSKSKANLRTDESSEDMHSRPLLRTAPEGRRNSPCGLCHRGIPPPPEEGWNSSKSGWDKHPESPNWMRRVAENDALIFFHVPDKSMWATMPGRGFAHVDMCLQAIAFSRDTQALRKQCFLSWREQIRVVRAWRQKIQVMAAVDSEADDAASGDDLEVTTENFPLRTAFIAPPALRSKSKIPADSCSVTRRPNANTRKGGS